MNDIKIINIFIKFSYSCESLLEGDLSQFVLFTWPKVDYIAYFY